MLNTRWNIKSPCHFSYRLRGNGAKHRKYAIKHRTEYGLFVIELNKRLAGKPPSINIPTIKVDFNSEPPRTTMLILLENYNKVVSERDDHYDDPPQSLKQHFKEIGLN